MPQMPIVANHIGTISGRWPTTNNDGVAAPESTTPSLTPEASSALFMAAFCRHGKDGHVGDRPQRQSNLSLEDRLAAATNPSIEHPDALNQCYDLGRRLASLLSQGSGGRSMPSRVIFLSSPIERALQTAEQVTQGFSDYYKEAYGDSAASLMDPTIHVLEQLRERLDGNTRDWRATRTEIAANHPTADVSLVENEADPAQSENLHLIPEDTDRSEEPLPIPGRSHWTRSPAVGFIQRPRGVLESLGPMEPSDSESAKSLRPHQFEERLVALGDLMIDLAQKRREKTGHQPVLVAISHYLTVNRFLAFTHSDKSGPTPRVRAGVNGNTQCVLSTYDKHGTPQRDSSPSDANASATFTNST